MPSPEIQFGGGQKLNPGTAGRWDLRGKKFFTVNSEPLKSWGICILDNACPEATARNFVNTLVQIYSGHGGRIENRSPVIYQQSRNEPLPEAVVNARNAAGNQAKLIPQIMIYVLRSRDSFAYERLKKNNEIRFSMVSQCKRCSPLFSCLLTFSRRQCCSCPKGPTSILQQCCYENKR